MLHHRATRNRDTHPPLDPDRLLHIEHTTQADPTAHTRLMQGLDGFLERDQDRALFDLPPRPKDA